MLSPIRTVANPSHGLLIAAAFAMTNGAYAAAGDPAVQVESDGKTDATHIRAHIDIAAPPAVVWAVITDCARSPQIIPNLESCRIVKRDAAGKWDVREHIINWATLLPRLRTVVRNTYDTGRRLVFKLIDGDMRISEGEWRLDPIARGTRLSYNALMAPNFPVPKVLIEQALYQDFPNLLRAIQSASVADAKKSVIAGKALKPE